MKVVTSLVASLSIVAFAYADMTDGPPLVARILNSPVINGNQSGLGIAPITSGRFLPVIEASGSGSSSPFIRMQFCVWNGNKVIISGVYQTIPSGNCTAPGAGVIGKFSSACLNKVCGSTLSASTSYYAGVYMLNGVMTMNFWPVSGGAGWTTDQYGVKVKGDDPGTSLVGLMYLNGTTTMDGSANKQNSVSVFNKVRIPIIVTENSGGFTNTTMAEVNGSTARLEWVSIFGDEAFFVIAPCTVSNNAAGAVVTIGIGIDSNTVSTGNTASFQSPGANYTGNATSIANTDTSDGHHYASFLASVSGNTGTITSCQMATTPLPS